MVEKSHTLGTWPGMFEPFRSFGQRVADWVAPASEAASDDQSYRIVMELPGVAEEDIDLSVADGVVTVKGEKRAEREEKGETWFFSERQYGAFSRSFRLPPDADSAAIDGALKDGVLTVSIGRRAPDADEGAQKIAINKG